MFKVRIRFTSDIFIMCLIKQIPHVGEQVILVINNEVHIYTVTYVFHDTYRLGTLPYEHNNEFDAIICVM